MNRAAKDFIFGLLIAMLGAALLWAMWITAPSQLWTECQGDEVAKRWCTD